MESLKGQGGGPGTSESLMAGYQMAPVRTRARPSCHSAPDYDRKRLLSNQLLSQASDKRLKLAQLLGQRGDFLTLTRARAAQNGGGPAGFVTEMER